MRPAGVPDSSLSSRGPRHLPGQPQREQRHHAARDRVAEVEEPEVAVVVDELDDGGEGDEVHDPRDDRRPARRRPASGAAVAGRPGGVGWPQTMCADEEQGPEHEDPHAVDEVPVEREHSRRDVVLEADSLPGHRLGLHDGVHEQAERARAAPCSPVIT